MGVRPIPSLKNSANNLQMMVVFSRVHTISTIYGTTHKYSATQKCISYIEKKLLSTSKHISYT
uniref:Uncharacterized protein n=1 Tax=Arundo donax TaxID=35708 RepID=A0A0A9FQL7_ARUDO